jgi:hypothetical protein
MLLVLLAPLVVPLDDALWELLPQPASATKSARGRHARRTVHKQTRSGHRDRP